MEEERSGVYKSEQIENSSSEILHEVEEPLNVRQFEAAVTEMEDSQLFGVSPFVAEEASVVLEETTMMVAEEATAATEVEMKKEVVSTSRSGGKRKRARMGRVQNKAQSKKKEEEDVCFICFDGGNLVLCDRRGCPKAYHPSCVNRDEAFFRAKGRWNCGWHICSKCEKAAHYMCYTCTYSLCKGCIKEADFLCIRGNKGFCETCMRTVMLIEKNDQDQVNFDDKSNWEYFFKDYWIDLKGKLSLTLDELSQARNLWKGSDTLVHKEESSDELCDANGNQGSNLDSSSGHLEVANSKIRKAKRRSNPSLEEGPQSVGSTVGGEGTSRLGDTEWASKELLEIVAYMKNGDTSVLSQFDVQALLLQYIKRNNLRDPRRKSQIVCDLRLENLFGKARVGHFEMLKLLESHFLIKEDSQANDIQGEIIDTEASLLEAEGRTDVLTKVGIDKRCKTRKKGEEGGPQTNLDDYAAIDVHNINLLYLRRNLMEDLLEDSDKFHDKVVGSFVRIRISGLGQKHDMYRLVQVIGTRKASEPYKTGKRLMDVVLEIINLNKTEIISIDTISNQEFSEDECKRLRQSMKCGLISRMTVGEVQEKAMVFQAVRVNDWLETEKLRFTHLRDRASEKGRRKELRECVEKLQLLNTSEEHLRRLQEIPEVHADPNMDPSYVSEEDEGEPDDKKQDNFMRPRDAGSSRKGREPISQGKGNSASKDTWSESQKNSIAIWEPSKNMPAKGVLDKVESATGFGDVASESFQRQGRDAHQSNSWEKPKTQVPPTGSDTDTSNSLVRSGSSPGIAPETALAPVLKTVAVSPNVSETDKMWHYRDPSGKIQGPFSMVQLRKWSTTGYFPPDLRIWRTIEKHEDSILLTEALCGKFHKEQPQWGNSFSQPLKGTVVSDSGRENNRDGRPNVNNNSTWTERNQSDGSWNSNRKDLSGPSNGMNKLVKNDGRQSSISSGWTESTPDLKGTQTGYSSRGWNSSKGNNAWSGQSQVHSLHPSPSFSGKPHQPPFDQGESQVEGILNSVQNRGNSMNSNRSTGFQSSTGHDHEMQSNNCGSSGQSGENWRSQPENNSSKGWVTPSSVEASKFAEGRWSADHDSRQNSLNLPSPTPKPSSASWTGGQVFENKRSITPTSTLQPENSSQGTGPSLGGNGTHHSAADVTEPNKTASGWSNLHSSTPSVRGWDSRSAFMRKPSNTSDQDDRREFSNPPTPTPKPSFKCGTEGQVAENKWAATSTVSVKQTGSDFGSIPIPGDKEAHQSPPTVSVWGSDTLSASLLKPIDNTNGHASASNPENGRLARPSTSPPVLMKPNEGIDDGVASHASSCQQPTISVVNSSWSLTNQSVPAIPTKDNTRGLNTHISVKGGGDLIKGSENDPSGLLHDLSPKFDAGKDGGALSSADAKKYPSQSTMTDEPHRVMHGVVLDTQMKAGVPSPSGAEMDGEIGQGDVPVNVSMGTQGFVPESQHAFAGTLMDVGASSVPELISQSQTFNPIVSVSVSSGNSHGPQEENHRWGYGSALKSEIDLRPGFDAHGWGPVPAPKQEPPSSTPAPVAQKPEQPYYAQYGPSSAHYSACFNTADQAGSHPISGSSVSIWAPSGNGVPPPNTIGTGWRPTPEHPNAALFLPQGNANMGWGGPAQGNVNMGWGAPPQGNTTPSAGAMLQGNTNMGWGAPPVNTGKWGSEQKHNGERFSGHPDRGFHRGDSGHGGDRPSWNRKLSFSGGGGGGGSSRPPPKVQRM